MTKDQLSKIASRCIETEYHNGWRADSLVLENMPANFSRKENKEGEYEYVFCNEEGDKITFVDTPNSHGSRSVSFYCDAKEK